jgi:hypothetical protein
MSWIELSLLAQANPAPALEDVTAGQIFSGLLVLGVMAASMVMIVVWVVRLGQTGHALPVAQRGILRVPAPLTFVAIGLSLLMMLLMALVPTDEQILPAAAANPAALASDETANAESTPATPETQESPASADDPSMPGDDTSTAPNPQGIADADSTIEAINGTDPGTEVANTEDKEKSDADAEPQATEKAKAAAKMTPAQMKNALVQTVIMDLVLFGLLGLFVFLASSNGRVALQENGAPLPSTGDDRYGADMSSGSTMWPDLDDRSAIPQHSGYSILGDRDPFWSAEPPKATQQLESGDAAMSQTADEPFSFLTELRFAGEVFLAAYVPTAILRILIVLLTVGLLGEEPDQHPFLEMMTSGVGRTILTLILLTAVFLAPLVEELQFRVIMLGGLAQMGRPMLALSISSILFAFAHGFPDSLALLPLAFALGYTYLRRRSYITVMLVHFLFNGFNMVLALLAML